MGQTESEILRQATREAHEVLGDLRRTVKEARGVLKEIEELRTATFEKEIAAQVQEGLAGYEATLKEAMGQGVDHVMGEFDKLEGILLGTDPKSKRQGKESIEDLARRKAALLPGPLPDPVVREKT